MERRIGLPHPRDVKAADQLQKGGYDRTGVQPLPSPYSPGRATPESVGIKDPGADLTFIVIGDHGGIENPQPQKNVATALAEEVAGGQIAFIYSLGDIDYFAGDPAQYMQQFYQPYCYVKAPFVAIGGNHDGSPDGTPGSGMASFMANWVTATPSQPPSDPENEFGRDTQTQPSHDWTLNLEAATLIGFWSNAPSGGHLFPEQIAWLTEEIKAAPTDRPLFVNGHHPVYSCDAMHGGSAHMGQMLDGIFEAAGRYPDAVSAGHIHNEQAFVRTVDGKRIFYGIEGNSGYHNTHAMAGDATPGMQVAPDLVLAQFDAGRWGYQRWQVTPSGFTVSYVAVNADGSVESPVTVFSS